MNKLFRLINIEEFIFEEIIQQLAVKGKYKYKCEYNKQH